MPTNTINTERNHIDWPLNQRLEQPGNRQKLFELLGLQALDGQGNNINNQVAINDRQVQYQVAGEYPVFLTAVTASGQQLQHTVYLNLTDKMPEYPTDGQPANAETPAEPSTPAPSQPAKPGRSKKGLIALLAVLALIIGGFVLHQHNVRQRAQEAQQSSTAGQISGLQHKNKQLQAQINQLKAAQQQYQQDHDRDTLNSRLNQLQSDNDQLKQQLSQREANDLDTVSRAIDQIRQHPDQGQAVIDQLDSGSNAQDTLTQLKDNIEAWLATHH